jgi:hypothetical protein
MSQKTCHDRELAPPATKGSEMKVVYRRLALEPHPDLAGAADDDFILLHDAYVRPGHTRSRYDRDVISHAYAQPPASRPSLHGFWGRPRLSSETDQRL